MSIVINGRVISTERGASVSVSNGVVRINGRKIADLPAEPVFHIEVSGNVDTISGDFATITVNGDVNGSIRNASGNVSVEGAVSGDVHSMSGDVKVKGAVSGDVSTMSGDIRHR